MTGKILLGFQVPSGKPVKIGVSHTVYAGITRVGKSETVKTAVTRSKDIRFLILDVKKPRDYEGLGVEIPIYIEEKTEPLMLKRLLESQSHLALKFEFPELLKVCKKASTYPEILEAVNEGLEAKKHPIVKDKLLVLQHLLSRLVHELERTPIADKLELKNRVNVMDLSDVSKEMQQLAVHSTLKELLKKHRDVVVIADEFHRFAPQYGSNASKETVTDYIKEGGAKNLWLWVIDQTITGVEKQILKQCWIWILGKQRELNEAKRTLDQIPFKTGLTEKAIMRLKKGHFIVCTEDFAKLTYVWLPDVPEDMARKVTGGKLSVQDVINFLEKVRKKEEDEEMVWKEKYEKLEAEFSNLKREFNKLADTVGKLEEEKKQLLKEKTLFAKSQEMVDEYEKRIQDLTGRLERAEDHLKAFQELRAALAKILPTRVQIPAAPGAEVPSEVAVHIEQPVITIVKERQPLTLKQADLEGRIAIVYAEGLLPKDKAFTLRQLNRIMESRFGTKEFPGNLPKVLNKLVGWGYLEKVQAGKRWDWRVKMSPKEAEEKNLLKVVDREKA